ncbi:MAG: phosphopantetheine-binding protein [Actinomycetota bacterium]
MDDTQRLTFSDALLAFVRSEVALFDDPLEMETDLVLTGLVDSLGVVVVVEWIEQRLDIEIDPGDVVIEHFESVGAMVRYLAARGDCTVD